MSSPPTLSVVVPNYNHAKYLELSLPAILKQSYRPLEVIVLDDASKDNSVEVIRRIAAQEPIVRLVQNEKNLTVVPNLNKGFELARGDYVFIGSADDEVLPGIFEHSMRLLAQHPKAALSCTVSQWRYEQTGLSFFMGVGMADGPAFLSPDELVRVGKRGKLMMSSSSIVYRREALLEVGRFVPRFRWLADWFAIYTSALRHGICFVPEPLSLVNIIPKSHYTHGSKQPEHLTILRGMVEMINSPPFADVKPRIRASGCLSLYATPMLKVLLSRKEFWPYLNATFLRWTLWRNAELIGRDILPRSVAKWVLNRFYAIDKNKPAAKPS